MSETTTGQPLRGYRRDDPGARVLDEAIVEVPVPAILHHEVGLGRGAYPGPDRLPPAAQGEAGQGAVGGAEVRQVLG